MKSESPTHPSVRKAVTASQPNFLAIAQLAPSCLVLTRLVHLSDRVENAYVGAAAGQRAMNVRLFENVVCKEAVP